MFLFSTLLLLSWGALAFGAEYAWAYTPLLVFSCVPAVLGLRESRGTMPSRLLLAILTAVFLLAAVQIVAPAHIVPIGLQPGAPGVDFVRLYDTVTMRTPVARSGAIPISIEPSRTALGLVFFGAFVLLLAGCTRAISALGVSKLARGIAVLGVLVAFIGIAQRSAAASTVYGFWDPPRDGVTFAPFINENHFAGWMAMVMSLSIGLLAGSSAGSLTSARGWRNRTLWFASTEGNHTVLMSAAVVVMAFSMIITFSRGGLVGLVTIFGLATWWMIRGMSGAKRAGAGLCVTAIVLFVASWGGADRTIREFSGATVDLGQRRSIWIDTLRIARDFPMTGTGLNTFGIAMLHYQTDRTVGAVTESHNDYLQIAAEGGLMLGVPILAALGVFSLQVWRRFREHCDDRETYWIRVGAVVGLCAIGVMEIFDFILQMPGAAAMFVTLAAIAMHRPNDHARGRRREHVEVK